MRVLVRVLPRDCADGTLETLRWAESTSSPAGQDTPSKTLSRSPSTATQDSTRPATQADKTHVLEIRVVDNGPGIPDHLQKKVFEPFVQAEMRLSKMHDGVGLGLSICRQIIKILGGSIRLESQVGVGSTFMVQVPVSVTERTEATAPTYDENVPWGKDCKPHLSPVPEGLTNGQSGSFKILVAEDNPTNRTVIVQMLKMQKLLG